MCRDALFCFRRSKAYVTADERRWAQISKNENESGKEKIENSKGESDME